MVFVDPASAVQGNGQKFSPFKDIGSAAGALPPGGTLVLAAGNYRQMNLNIPMRLVGRCAALVKIIASGGAAEVRRRC